MSQSNGLHDNKVVWGDIAPNFSGIITTGRFDDKIIEVKNLNKNEFWKINDSGIDFVLTADTFDINNLAIHLLKYNGNSGLWFSDLATINDNNTEIFNFSSFRNNVYQNDQTDQTSYPFVKVDNKKVAFVGIKGYFGDIYIPYFDLSYNFKQTLIDENSAINVVNIPPSNPNTNDIYVIGLDPIGAFIGQSGKIATWNKTSWVFTDVSGQSVAHNGATNITMYWSITKR